MIPGNPGRWNSASGEQSVVAPDPPASDVYARDREDTEDTEDRESIALYSRKIRIDVSHVKFSEGFERAESSRPAPIGGDDDQWGGRCQDLWMDILKQYGLSSACS